MANRNWSGCRTSSSLTTKNDLDATIAGIGDEEGRIGFVAVTRAKELLVIGILSNTGKDVVDVLVQRGFAEWKPGQNVHPV